MITMHIGFDDTDSPRMGCTTYVAALLVEELLGLGASFIDYPNLIRLNPNVPWKTRGNGALCLRIKCNQEIVEKIMEVTIVIVEENADMKYDGTDPGIVFFFDEIPKELKSFSERTIHGVVKMKEALKLIKTFGAEAVGFKSGRGIIGGLAAIGETLDEDHTYEIITYRTVENRGTPRKIEDSSVAKMNEKTAPLTFNNIDLEKGRILITPRGPDPILYGIRGETAEIVKQAHEMINSEEAVERWVIFRTNHGTDAHLRRVGSISEVKPYNPVVISGVIARGPQIIPRRHVIFSVRDETGQVDCAAYEPTGVLREAAKRLMVGDLVEACGGVRPSSSKHPMTVNLEKMRIVKLVPKLAFYNPKCPQCGKRMKSLGKGKGFKCEKCGFRSLRLNKISVESSRGLEVGLYITSPRSQRHLTKPHSRYGRGKSQKPHKVIQGWHFP